MRTRFASPTRPTKCGWPSSCRARKQRTRTSARASNTSISSEALAVASTTTRLALVTGTTSGIGAALAKQLLQRGWEVAGVARRKPTLENPRYHHLAIDLGDVPMAVKSIEIGRASCRERV